jgi:purine-nucleoside phosphorylase
MQDLPDRIESAARFLSQEGLGPVDAGLILDGELEFVVPLGESVSVSFNDAPGFPTGPHADGFRIEAGSAEGMRVLAVRGRLRGCDGVSLREATIPVRVARALGAKWIILAGAADPLDPSPADEKMGNRSASVKAGDIVFSTDQINWMGDNPLIGPHDERLGVRFPDMSSAYDPALLECAEKAAKNARVETRRGIYAGYAGPQRLTGAEKAMLRSCGADLAGMWAVPETIVAAHSGLKVLGISVLDDAAAGSWPRIAREASPHIEQIVRGVLRELGVHQREMIGQPEKD